eukprot:g27429.t1
MTAPQVGQDYKTGITITPQMVEASCGEAKVSDPKARGDVGQSNANVVLFIGQREVSLCALPPPGLTQLTLLQRLSFPSPLRCDQQTGLFLAITTASEVDGEMDVLLHGTVNEPNEEEGFSIRCLAASRLVEALTALWEVGLPDAPPGLVLDQPISDHQASQASQTSAKTETEKDTPPARTGQSGVESSDELSGDAKPKVAASTVQELTSFMEKRAHRASDAVVEEVLKVVGATGAPGAEGAPRRVMEECKILEQQVRHSEKQALKVLEAPKPRIGSDGWAAGRKSGGRGDVLLVFRAIRRTKSRHNLTVSDSGRSGE